MHSYQRNTFCSDLTTDLVLYCAACLGRSHPPFTAEPELCEEKTQTKWPHIQSSLWRSSSEWPVGTQDLNSVSVTRLSCLLRMLTETPRNSRKLPETVSELKEIHAWNSNATLEQLRVRNVFEPAVTLLCWDWLDRLEGKHDVSAVYPDRSSATASLHINAGFLTSRLSINHDATLLASV